MPDTHAPYSRSAAVYDAIYEEMKSYHNEASRVLSLVEELTGRKAKELSLLDVACGTGLHLQHWIHWFGHVEGCDLSEEQLDIARRRLAETNKDYWLRPADMLQLDFYAQRFDAVTCLFSAIGHMTSIEKMRQAVAQMARVLKPGGVLIVEPWIQPGDYLDDTVHSQFVNRENLKIARICHSGSMAGRVSVLTMHHLVGTPQGVEHFVETHHLGLYTHEQYVQAAIDAGLTASFNPEGLSNNGRGIIIGVKPL